MSDPNLMECGACRYWEVDCVFLGWDVSFISVLLKLNVSLC